VHWSESSQAVPLFFVGLEQAPFVELQTPATWHWSCAVQTTGFAPEQAPAWHVSVCVQASPSAHVVPSAFGGFVHLPVEGLQTPAM
jgi:hypothetical protein